MSKLVQFLSNYRNALLTWVAIAVLIFAGMELGVDKPVIAFVVVIVGLLGEAFAALMAWIAFIPIIGPIIAKVLALPFFWILNGIGYLGSFVAIRRGFSKEVMNYRVLTIVLLIGVTIGYIIGKVI